uniref:C2H2-type domain-containing protein n=1 Tax=Rhodnius prolixus TaxID=13249 RepID=T1IBG9_RHOPR
MASSPEQLSSENGLVATPLGISGELQPPAGRLIEDTSSIKDPIQRALIDNICGNLPDRNPVEYVKCEICNVDCNGKVSYRIHLSGAKHAKRLKEQEMLQYKELPFIKAITDTGTYSCTICGAILNAISQIQAHISGNKHKAKVASNKTGTCNIEITNEPGKPGVDATPNLLYCAACNIHVNSATQFQQHTASKRHINKVNGSVARRAAPYFLKKKGAGTNGAKFTSNLHDNGLMC